MYLVGLSGLRSFNRGISVLTGTFALAFDRAVLALVAGPYDPVDV